MTITYTLYGNDGLGGPIDYSTPLGTTSGLSIPTPALSPNGNYLFAIRAKDSVSGLEEANVDAIVRIVTNASNQNVTGRPASISDITVRPGANGAARVSWSVNLIAGGGYGQPTGFKVWVTVGASANYAASPNADIPAISRQNRYEVEIPGLVDGTAYSIGVRAYNLVADDGNAMSVPFAADGTGPAAAESFAGSVVSGD